MTDQELAHIIKNNTRVILPQFGAFLQKRNDDGQFNNKELTFSSFLRYNDNFLEAEIARLHSCSIDQASQEVSRYIDNLQQTLTQKGAYAIGGLGNLSMGGNNQVLFNYDASTPSTLAQADNQNEQPTTQPIETQIQQQPNPSPTEQHARTTEMPRKQSTKNTPTNSAPAKAKTNKTQTTKTSWGKRLLTTLIFVAVSVAIIMGIAYLIRYTVFAPQRTITTPENIVQPNANKPRTENANSNQPKDELDRAFDRINTDQSAAPVAPKTAPVAPKNATKPTTSTEQKIEQGLQQSAQTANRTNTTDAKFYLIVGSFKERANADKLQAEMTTNGLNAVVVERSNGSFIVSLGTYATRDQANAAKQQHADRFPAAWVMTIGND